MTIYWIFVKHYAGLAFKFVAKYPWQILAIALAIAAYLGWSNASKWESRANRENAAHAETVKGYEAALKLARKQNLDQVAAIESRQARVIEKEVVRYVEAKSNYSRALSDRMRKQTASGGSDPGKCNIPVISEVPGETLRDTETAIISRKDAEIVAENQAKLEAIIAAWLALE